MTPVGFIPRLAISLSGGETSAVMANLLLTQFRHLLGEVVLVFANTGQENEATLEFVRDFSLDHAVEVVWLEAKVDPRHRKGTSFRRVDFASASRQGEPFEEVIRKYGIPNKAYPHCTRELKLAPIYAYLDSLGWEKGGYKVAVGMRIDEPKRLRKNAAEQGLVYPLAHWCDPAVDKTDVNLFWEDQPYRLQLQPHQGNCRTCWKKSEAKLLRIMAEDPSAFDFFARMESEYGLAGHNVDGTKRVFFRGNQSVEDLRKKSAAGAKGRVTEDRDEDSGCSESCEAFGDEFDAVARI